MTVTTLIIARHGNTFAPGEAPRRVGSGTDLPLVESGRAQGERLGQYLKEHLLVPDRVYTSTLQRTREMAQLAAPSITAQSLDIFNELDYGADENQPEDQVRARLGESAMTEWEENGVVPAGWSPSADQIKQNWSDFAGQIFRDCRDSKTLIITSNGIARFALSLTGNWDQARMAHDLKLSTGAFGLLTRRADDSAWTVVGWNIRP